MRGKKLDQLFQAARGVTAPAASATLAEEVVRALRREPLATVREPSTLMEELNAGFPRLALVTLVILALGVAANMALGPADNAGLDAGLPPISAPGWLVPEEF